MTTATLRSSETETLYANLEERILGRDQVGASIVFHDLVRAGRPLTEMIGETVRIHAPYTHVPFHQRLDDGVVRFVNNDHCLLSARVGLKLQRFVGKQYGMLPMAQTIWYVPTGLDPWNQLLGKMPGHYGRGRFQGVTIPPPEVHWRDQQPLALDGTIDERLNQWLTMVQYSQVERAYGVFLGLLQEKEHRERVLAHYVFAGLINVQDRMIYNRSYTTGHKSYRARAMVELSEAVGWENAGSVIYAAAPDMAVGPHWYSAYESACEVAWIQLAEEDERQRSSIGPSPKLPPERRFLANEIPLTSAECQMLTYAVTRAPDPAYIDAISALLMAGKNPRQIVDVFQTAAARLVLETGDMRNFSMTQHCYEYANTLGWFFDRFDHPHRLKLLYVAGSFLTQTAHWLRNSPGNGDMNNAPTAGMEDLTRDQILAQLDDAMVRRNPIESVGLVRAYLKTGHEQRHLVRTLALGAAKQGNDTHNQELGLCFLEDWEKNGSPQRDLLLWACAHHTAGHVKYGDVLEPYRRFTEAMGIGSRQAGPEGDGDPSDALLDD